MAGLMDFSLYDDKGKKYTTKVTAGEAAILMIDGNKCFQRLKELKEREKERRDCDAASSSSQPQPGSLMPSKMRKRKWDHHATGKFLNECVKYRKWLRYKVPPPNVWLTITNAVNSALMPLAQYDGHYNYSVAEAKEKMRSLKNTFKECKQGKHNGEQWLHYWLMVYIFDEAIVAGDVTLAPEGVNFTSSIVEGSFEVQNGVLVPIASSTLLMNSSSSQPAVEEDMNNDAHTEQLGAVCENNDEGGANAHAVEINLCTGPGPSNSPLASPLRKKVKKSPSWKANILKSPRKRKSCKLNIFRSHSELENNENDEGIGILPEISEDMPLEEGEYNAHAIAHSDPPAVSTPKTPLKRTVATFNANILKSPHRNSPRKRKTPKHVLNFDNNTTEIFVSECLEHKTSLQSETIGVKSWKDLSAALETKHKVLMKWDVCRDKFCQMKEFFLKTLLPLEGYLSGIKWPYYDRFCDLYDIPTEYHSIIVCPTEDVNEEGDDEDEVPGKGSKLWPLASVELLLDIYKTKKEKFESTKSFLKHNLLFSQIALQLHDFTGQQYSSQQCQDKFNKLMEHFRSEYDKANRTGAAPSTWEHYKKILDMYKGNPTLVAPFLSSVGMAVKYCVNGVQQASGSSGEGSRSRPTNEYTPKTDKPVRKAPEKKIFKSSYQEVQVSKLKNQVELNNELRLLRLTLEQGGIDRKEYMNRLIDKL